MLDIEHLSHRRLGKALRDGLLSTKPSKGRGVPEECTNVRAVAQLGLKVFLQKQGRSVDVTMP